MGISIRINRDGLEGYLTLNLPWPRLRVPLAHGTVLYSRSLRRMGDWIIARPEHSAIYYKTLVLSSLTKLGR